MGASSHNIIADMYGPSFLFVYFIAIVMTVIVCRSVARQAGSAGPAPLIPENPDPFQMAYLRGGEAEVVRLATFDLIQRNALTNENGKLVRDPSVQPTGLPGLYDAILRHFTMPNTPASIFSGRVRIMDEAKALCRPYDETAKRLGLFVSDNERSAALRISLVGMLFITLLGGYKIIVALANGHSNVGFLVLFDIIGLITIGLLCRQGRLSRRGKLYLQRLQTAFQRLNLRQNVNNEGLSYDPALVMVGIFGFGALAGTPYSAYARSFRQAAPSGGAGSYSSGTGCGSCSGGGSSSGGSSSCGGGDGGGGGGCGGCGGG